MFQRLADQVGTIATRGAVRNFGATVRRMGWIHDVHCQHHQVWKQRRRRNDRRSSAEVQVSIRLAGSLFLFGHDSLNPTSCLDIDWRRPRLLRIV